MFYGVGILKSELRHYACHALFLLIEKKLETKEVTILFYYYSKI